MILVGFFSWWYGAGWRNQILRTKDTLVRINDHFSIQLLIKTLFSPFRQISAGATGNDMASKLRAFGDRLFSRLIGAFVRTFMIIFGLIAIMFALIFSLIRLALWPILLFLPIVGIILMISVGAPWNLV